MTRRDLSPLFEPETIAIVGASNDTGALRGRIPMQLIKGGFRGKLWPVHLREKEIQGLPAYPSLADLPGKLDLALIVIPADKVLEAVSQAADAGARAALVFTSGFAEEGGEGNKALQEELGKLARERNILLAGPNSVGFLNAGRRIAATFSPSIAWEDFERERKAGERPRTAIVSHSGGLAFSISLRGAARGLSFSKIISTGNEADVDCADVLEHLIDDLETGVVILFLEQIRRGRAFMAAAARALAKGKAIVATKVGRSAAGARAAASHTASLTGPDAVHDAVFRRYGVIRVDDIDELIDVAAAFTFCPVARGRRVGIVTVSGGVGGWMADALTGQGLQVPELSAALQGRIREFLPSYGSAFNPVDVTAGSTQNDHHVRALETVAASGEVDAVVVVSALSSDVGLKREEARFRAIGTGQRQSKPVLLYTYPLPKEGMVPWLADMGLPVYLSLKGCARAIAALAEHGALRDAVPALPGEPKAGDVAPELLEAGQSLTEVEAKRLLAPHGIAGPPHVLARDADGAVAAARSLGLPVALKIQSRAIPHKTEVGGVLLRLASEAEVREGVARILRSARETAPFARIDGLLVQRMAPPGLEAIVGASRDPVFGPIVTVGLGGIHAEVLQDVASAPAPIGEADALALIRQLRAWPLLEGVRGAKPADAEALARIVAALSRFASDYQANVAEIDLNPVLVHPRGEGVSVVDALIVTG